MYEINYTKTFAPIIKNKSLKIFLAIVILLGIIILQMDIISVYLENAFGQKDYLIYMKISQSSKIG